MDSADVFVSGLAALVEKIEAALAADAATRAPKSVLGEGTGRSGDEAARRTETVLLLALDMLRDALEKEDVGRVDRLLEELTAAQPGGGADALLSRVSELVLSSEFQQAAEAVRAFMGERGGRRL
jgi:hypothetical protein